jgi:hypothetical protein
VRPFLLVGCGGSGGVTLQFLADQLAADLAQRNVHSMPRAWQFVHVDVPLAPDGGGGDLPPVIGSEKGGRYVYLAPQAASYTAVLSSVSEQLISTNRYSQLATWVANPNEAPVDLSEGAGQMRAVGRIVTLSRLAKVRDGLQAALEGITATGAAEELGALARLLGTRTEDQSEGKPLVVVVSSMAGGAGASMVLDVCRLLSHMTGIAAESTALFLYTPEIFDSVPAHLRGGVPGNALATMSELMATQLGAATHDDDEIFAALGMGTSEANRGIPFGRVFPIGAYIGDTGARFADGDLLDIYRGVGRGLAALMLSGEATKSWSAYDLANNAPIEMSTTDFAWGGVRKDNQWGSFGFAQLSLGRDRYAEYAAQRLARSGVIRLTSGHRQPQNPATDAEQLERIAHDRAPQFYDSLRLPKGEGLAAWFGSYFDVDAGDAGTRLVTDRVDRVLSQPPGNAQQWIGFVVNQVAQQGAAHNLQADSEAYNLVHGFYEELLTRTEQTVAAVVTSDGIPTAIKLVSRLQRDLDLWATETRDGARQLRTDAASLPAAVLTKAQAISGNIDARHQIIKDFRQGYLFQSTQAVKGAILQRLGDVLVSYKNDMLEPLLRGLSEASASLQLALSSNARAAGLAQLRTDVFGEWPDAGPLVPSRFTHAQNEVLLVDATEFPARFGEHVTQSMRTPERLDISPDDATVLAIRQIISDRWETMATRRTGALLVQLSRWRPSTLSRLPGKDESPTTGPAAYRLAVLPRDLLGRARDWIATPNAPFASYVSTSLRQYLAGDDVADYERVQREQEVAAKFRNTLELAQPLVGINPTMVSAMHKTDARVSYKFSEVPFGGLQIGDDLVRDIGQGSADVTSVKRLQDAMRSDSKATRIDVFGSFTPLAPLTFSSLLRPLAAGWSNANMPGAREQFWALRRSRRLSGAVAMNNKQRQAVIGGWYLARFTGRLRYPGETHAVEAVQVYDEDGARAWLSFPHPLIVSKLEQDRTTNNFLPAVLMSFGLALAKASATSSLDPLRPYTVLRQYWDASASGISDHDSVSMLTASKQMSTWLTERQAPTGAPVGRVTPSLGDPELDRAALLEEIEKIRAALGTHYLRPGEVEGAVGGGQHSVVHRQQDIWAVPLFHEVARDAFVVLGTLSQIVAEVAIGGRTSYTGFDDVVLGG